MKSRLIVDGNAVYEIDEECLESKQEGWGRRKRRCRSLEAKESHPDPDKTREPAAGGFPACLAKENPL